MRWDGMIGAREQQQEEAMEGRDGERRRCWEKESIDQMLIPWHHPSTTPSLHVARVRRCHPCTP